MKTALGVFIGIILGFTLDSFAKFLGQTIQPLPIDLVSQDIETIRNWYEEAPFTALLFLPVSWFVGGLTGAFIAERLSDWPNYIAGFVTALAMYCIGLLFLMIGPQPSWAWWLLGVSLFFGGLVGSYFGLKMKHRDTAKRQA